MIRTACLVFGLAAANADAQEEPEFREVDYDAVDRTLRWEPVYHAPPLYCLFILDSPGKARAWAVMDKSSPQADGYDTLYFDKNFNRDLTDEEERFVAVREKGAIGPAFHVGRITTPGTGETHELTVEVPCTKAVNPGAIEGGIRSMIHWREKLWIRCGYSSDGTGPTRWGESPRTAPILRPTPFGKLSFAYCEGNMGERPFRGPEFRGESGDVVLMLGKPGQGSHSLSVLPDGFVDFKSSKNRIVVTLIARDPENREVRSVSHVTGGG